MVRLVDLSQRVNARGWQLLAVGIDFFPRVGLCCPLASSSESVTRFNSPRRTSSAILYHQYPEVVHEPDLMQSVLSPISMASLSVSGRLHRVNQVVRLRIMLRRFAVVRHRDRVRDDGRVRR